MSVRRGALGLAALALGAIVYLAATRHGGDAPAAPPVPADAPARGATFAPPSPRPQLERPVAAPDRALAADLRDPDPKVRAVAMRDYARAGSPDPKVLVPAIRDPEPGVAIVAIAALGAQVAAGSYRGDELIAATADRNLPEKVRVQAMNAIGVVAADAHARALLQLLASADVTDRRSAAILLRHQDVALVADALIGALADADEVVRANALDSLRALARGRDFGADATAWRAFFARSP